MLKDYWLLMKPGIIFGNLITALGGFFLASKGHFDVVVFVAVAFGVSFVIASGCIFNNYIDRDIDIKMERTKNRGLVSGVIPVKSALFCACILGILGFLLLYFGANPLAALLALIGFVVYVGFYSLWLKRTPYGTLIGSISGAMPPVIGYCAISGSFDAAAITLFVIFSIWQIPHSYAIAIFRFNDYKNAGIPVLPVALGISTAKKHIVVYVAAFLVASLMLSGLNYTGKLYFVVALLMGLYWLYIAVLGFKIPPSDDVKWAKKLFMVSVIIVTILSVMMSVDWL